MRPSTPPAPPFPMKPRASRLGGSSGRRALDLQQALDHRAAGRARRFVRSLLRLRKSCLFSIVGEPRGPAENAAAAVIFWKALQAADYGNLDLALALSHELRDRSGVVLDVAGITRRAERGAKRRARATAGSKQTRRGLG